MKTNLSKERKVRNRTESTWSYAVIAKLLLAVVIVASASQAAFASDPIGVYAVINKVVFEPSDESAERVQIWGVFSVAEGAGMKYRAPELGYLYYQLPKQKPELAKREWNDMKALAGKLEAVGFASRYKEKGKVRNVSEEPSRPDLYPIGFGLIHVPEPRKGHDALEKLFETAKELRAKRTAETRLQIPKTPGGTEDSSADAEVAQ